MSGRDGLSPGDMGDPVAQSIRAEQNRDAMPTDEELAAAKREAQTCDRCGEHKPEDVTTRTSESYLPNCNSVQRPPHPLGELCDDCFDPTTKTDQIKELLVQDDVDYVIEYDCGILETESDSYDGDQEHRPQYWKPSVSIRKPRCGHTIETVWTDNDLDEL